MFGMRRGLCNVLHFSAAVSGLVGVAAAQLELTGRRRAWQIGRFSDVNRTFYAVLRNVFFFRTIVEVSK